jgi:hypothetical protein
MFVIKAIMILMNIFQDIVLIKLKILLNIMIFQLLKLYLILLKYVIKNNIKVILFNSRSSSNSANSKIVITIVTVSIKALKNVFIITK